MNHRRFVHMVAAPLAVVALAAAPFTALASHTVASHAVSTAGHAPRAVFVFGREGGNIRPLSVTIDDSGAVMGGLTSGTAAAPRLISKDAVDGLLKLATAEGFFKLPTQMIGHGLPDIGGRFITVHMGSTTHTVHLRFVQNAAFDQLYAVLSAVANIPA